MRETREVGESNEMRRRERREKRRRRRKSCWKERRKDPCDSCKGQSVHQDRISLRSVCISSSFSSPFPSLPVLEGPLRDPPPDGRFL